MLVLPTKSGKGSVYKSEEAWNLAVHSFSLGTFFQAQPTLNGITRSGQDLIQVGETMRDAPKGVARMAAFKRYAEIREEIQDEAHGNRQR